MTPENRLKQMKAYREVAMQSPEENELYIEDLNISITHFQNVVKHEVEVHSGFDVDSE